ncbi:MAG: hypothetical protein K6L81_15370 [Agarilytica sp.]
MSQRYYMTRHWLALFLGILCSSNLVHANSEFIAISDLNFRQCIHELSQKNNWQRPEDFLAIKCHNKNITRLDGIERFVNLETLSLHKNQISSINIGALTKLKRLNLARNNIKTLHLSNLLRLTEVFIFGNSLTQLEIHTLPKLQKLKASGNQLISFKYSALPALTKIYMFDNKMEHIDIHNLPSMKYMDVRQNPMPDPLYEEMDKLKGVTILHDGNADDWD